MNMMNEAARQVPHMMGNMGQMMSHPMTSGAMLAAGGFAAGKGLLGGMLRTPLVFLAAGVAAGYVLFKYEKEIIEVVSKASGMGKDFILHQRENLDDLIATAQSEPAATPSTPNQAQE
jgi:hypothetical protein